MTANHYPQNNGIQYKNWKEKCRSCLQIPNVKEFPYISKQAASRKQIDWQWVYKSLCRDYFIDAWSTIAWKVLNVIFKYWDRIGFERMVLESYNIFHVVTFYFTSQWCDFIQILKLFYSILFTHENFKNLPALTSFLHRCTEWYFLLRIKRWMPFRWNKMNDDWV